MYPLTNQSTGKQLLMVAALVMLTAPTGCKRSTSDSASAALGSSGVMDGHAATGSTADTSSRATAAADKASMPAAAAAASGASQ
ncbi:hypothetical protein [Paraburkholderia lacunae]|uniref:Uncharacterized protein n=1 Tax=Paraburkholderia lacunae TaxID=2211104 RepID=A0A370NA77_9BURK|nr:hypothetical protein [Paraburkholderia lacunae]RDK02487.1 hypothetical protein DLM46_12935 [Paraburkholderia lacunae]